MKKIMTTMALLAMVLFTASAQIKMKVTMNGPQEAITESGETVKLDGTLILPYDAITSIEYFRETVKGLHTVDLGLPSGTLWANFNFGANDSTEVGTQLTWADLSQISETWGADWKAPTSSQLKELWEKTDWEAIEEGGTVKGYLFTSRSNDNTLFLPFTGGYRKSPNSNPSVSTKNFYWASDLSNGQPYALSSDKAGAYEIDTRNAEHLLAVRPVYGETTEPTPQPVTPSVSLSLAKASAPTQTGVTYRITLTGDYDKVTECGVYYSTSSATLSASTNKVAGTRSGNTATVSLTGLSASTTYYLRAYAIVTGLSGEVYSSDVQFTTAGTEVKPDPTVEEDPDYPIAGYVNLGLPSGTKWATWNMGAKSVTDYGKLIGWGVLTDAITTLDMSVYAPNVPINESLPDTLDIATVKWGKDWQMPTLLQLRELEQCTWKDTIENGIAGYRVYGIDVYSDNSIFLPMAGTRTGETPEGVGAYAYYWSRQSSVGATSWAVMMRQGAMESIQPRRSMGCAIRPIYVGEEKEDPNDNTKKGHTQATTQAYVPNEAVNMGTSVKWSQWDVGATGYGTPGDYFSWGELEKDITYTSDSYSEEIKGMYFSANLEDKYDVARQQWRGKWRMPTQQDFGELLLGAKKEWTSDEKGNYGMKVTKAGKSIFFPAKGYKVGTNLYGDNSRCCYWTSTPISGTEKAYYLSLGEKDMGTFADFNRFYGLPVRPVWDETLDDLDLK